MKSKKSKSTKSGAILNRRAAYDYQLGDNLIVGIVLSGIEVRAARDHKISLKGSFITIKNQELWLNNASFTVNKPNVTESVISNEPRKLLATRRQINQLAKEKQTGMSIVPIKLLTNQRHIKLEIALGKGKKNYDKRQTIKKRDLERDLKIKRL